MRKCKTCGRRFRLLAKNRYEIMRVPAGLNRLTEETMYYNAFDCPHCGCQNIVGVVEKASVVEKTKESEETKPDIKDMLSNLDGSMGYILSFTNRETENDWIFDTIIGWRKMIQPYIKEE